MNEEHRNGRFDWRTIGVTVGIVLAGQLVQWGVFSATQNDHARRLDAIEKREQEQYLQRPEFNSFRDDMSRRTEENRERIQKIEEDRLTELQQKARR